MNTTVHLSAGSTLKITRGVINQSVVWLSASDENGLNVLTVFLTPQHLKELLLSLMESAFPAPVGSYQSRESQATAPVDEAQKEKSDG